jgi:hypothetical protein
MLSLLFVRVYAVFAFMKEFISGMEMALQSWKDNPDQQKSPAEDNYYNT